jgi:hypothetical protein
MLKSVARFAEATTSLFLPHISSTAIPLACVKGAVTNRLETH